MKHLRERAATLYLPERKTMSCFPFEVYTMGGTTVKVCVKSKHKIVYVIELVVAAMGLPHIASEQMELACCGEEMDRQGTLGHYLSRFWKNDEFPVFNIVRRSSVS